MRELQNNNKKSYSIGWGMLLVYTIIALLPIFVNTEQAQQIASLPMLVNIIFTVFVAVNFFGWKDMLVFYLISFVVTIIVENISVLYGIPFGFFEHYQAGPRIGNIPLTVGLGYFYYAMLGWIFADLIVGRLAEKNKWAAILGRPLIGMVVASAIDAIYDPVGSQIMGMYGYPYGGGFFGVPLSNSIGWFINVFLILFLFELASMFLLKHSHQYRWVGTPSIWHLQAVILLGLQAISPIVSFFIMPNQLVADGAGVVWNSHDLYETVSLIALHTMIFYLLVGVTTWLRRRNELSTMQETSAVKRS